MTRKRVEKLKKTNREQPITPSRRRRLPDSDGGHISKPRKAVVRSGDTKLRGGKYRIGDGRGAGESLKTFKQNKNERLYDFNDYPAGEFERMYQT